MGEITLLDMLAKVTFRPMEADETPMVPFVEGQGYSGDLGDHVATLDHKDRTISVKVVNADGEELYHATLLNV